MRRPARVDANQAEIVQALRQVGATVYILADVGQGIPDLLVGFRRVNHLLEIKAGKGKLNRREAEWHASWCGDARVVYGVDDALRAIGAI